MILAASFDTDDITMWENRGLMYGDGVFETMRCRRLQMPLWHWHQQRLQRSLDYLGMALPDSTAIEQAIKQQSDPGESILRLTVFRQHQQRGYQPRSRACHWLLSRYPYQSNDHPQTLGIARQTLSPQPLLNNLKHLNRLPQVLIAAELAEQSSDDLLVLDQDNHVIETTSQNIVVVRNNRLLTPAMRNCGVEGVALTWLKQHMAVETTAMTLTDLQQSEAVMTANAVHGFRIVEHIKTIGPFQINHPICDKIGHFWQQLIDSV